MTPDRWFTVFVSLVTFFLGWLVARHYQRRSDRRRIPTFMLQARQSLASPSLISEGGVRVIHEGAEVGANGITHGNIYFWNAGTLPILQSEVLEPYTISLPVQILRCSLLKSSREVAGIRVSVSGCTLTLDFAVLEPGDGATLYIVYDGPANANIEFGGACLDAAKPKILLDDPIYLVPKPKRFTQMWQGTLKGFGPLVGLMVVIFAGRWTVSKLFGEHGLDIAGIVLGLLVGAFFVFLIIFVLWYHFKRLTSPYLPPNVKP
jgi:hypothetical protein